MQCCKYKATCFQIANTIFWILQVKHFDLFRCKVHVWSETQKAQNLIVLYVAPPQPSRSNYEIAPPAGSCAVCSSPYSTSPLLNLISSIVIIRRFWSSQVLAWLLSKITFLLTMMWHNNNNNDTKNNFIGRWCSNKTRCIFKACWQV